jgi:hypothetical protein
MQVLRSMANRRKDECAESAGEGASAGAGKQSEPFAADEDSSPSTATQRSVPQGLPVSHTEFRALKERARTQQNPKDSVAQENGNGNEKGSEKDSGKR